MQRQLQRMAEQSAQQMEPRTLAPTLAPTLALTRPAVVDVAPIIDRLVIFYADYRVPHEVCAWCTRARSSRCLRHPAATVLAGAPFARGALRDHAVVL